MRRSSRSTRLEGPAYLILPERSEPNLKLSIRWWLDVLLPLHRGVTEGLLLLRQQISDSHHSYHTQSKRANLKCTNAFYRDYCDERVGAGVMRTHLHEDARAQKVPHFLQDLFLKYVPRHRALQIEDERIPKPAGFRNRKQFGLQSVLGALLDCKGHACCSVPAALLSSTGSVTHQQDNLLSLTAVLVRTLGRARRLLDLCGNPNIICACVL